MRGSLLTCEVGAHAVGKQAPSAGGGRSGLGDRSGQYGRRDRGGRLNKAAANGGAHRRTALCLIHRAVPVPE